VTDGDQQLRLLDVARDDDRPVLAAFLPALARIEDEAALALLLFDAVTLVAVRDEDRSNLRFEEVGLFLRQLLRRLGGGGKGQRRCARKHDRSGE
jgi:hypothetical protein